RTFQSLRTFLSIAPETNEGIEVESANSPSGESVTERAPAGLRSNCRTFFPVETSQRVRSPSREIETADFPSAETERAICPSSGCSKVRTVLSVRKSQRIRLPLGVKDRNKLPFGMNV